MSVASEKIQANREYAQRIDRVIDYLRGNLHRQVKLAELAKVACFSEFHFHRIFGAVAGETLNSFTNRLRLEKAARLLRYSEKSLTDIALDCGFSSPATFSRAFRAGYETSPRQFRESGEIKNRKICKDLFSAAGYLLSMSAEEKRAAFPVKLIDAPERQAAYIRVANAYSQIETAAGPMFFAVHPKKADAPKKCPASISVVFRVENLESSLLALKDRGLVPDSTEKDPSEGQFAHFHDPDGNEVTMWEGKQ